MKQAAAAAFLVFTACASVPTTYSPPRRMFVSVPVADVRARTKPHIGKYVQDPDQETQVEQGEPVLVKERRGGWVRIEAPQQPEYTHNETWEGYPGWVELALLTDDASREKVLTPDTRPDEALRKEVLEQAARHLGSPYLWGGRSLHSDYRKTVTGVDCSGLVNWSFRQVGRIVPRDAQEQFLKARRVEPERLMPGDLIFLAKRDRPNRMVHVSFYAGNGDILEAPQSGEAVRRISAIERFGKKLSEISNGETLGDRVIYFGTLFEGPTQ